MVNMMFLFVLIFVGVLIWLFMFLYDLWSPVLADVAPEMESMINYSANQTNDTAFITSARNSIENVRSVWKYWPFVLFLFLFIWVVVATQKTEPMYQNYGG